MKKNVLVLFSMIVVFACGLLLAPYSSPQVNAQTATQSATSGPKVTYPVTIPDVGTCASWVECRKLCSDPVNKTACFTWAKAQKLVTSPPADSFTKAATELGCTTKETCALFCQNADNKSKCEEVGKKYKLLPDTNANLQKILSTTQQQLGSVIQSIDPAMDSSSPTAFTTIRSACDKKENSEKCATLAEAMGVPASFTPGPGGCRSPQSCRAYCDNPENFTECQSFGFTGPNSCTSELSCYQSCESGTCTNTKSVNALSIPVPITDAASLIESQKKTCTSIWTTTSQDSVQNILTTVKKTGVCELYDAERSSDDTQTCAEYLNTNADKTVNAEEMRKYCTALPKIPALSSNGTQKNSTDQLKNRCELLKTLGANTPAYATLAASCESLSQTIGKAQTECDSTKQTTATIVTDESELRRYCLSAPADLSDYKKACAADQKNCTQGGYDWYCAKNKDKCAKLFEGQPLNKVADAKFSNGINAITALNAVKSLGSDGAGNIINGPTGPSGSRKSETPKPLFVLPRGNTTNTWDVKPVVRVSGTPATRPTYTGKSYGWNTVQNNPTFPVRPTALPGQQPLPPVQTVPTILTRPAGTTIISPYVPPPTLPMGTTNTTTTVQPYKSPTPMPPMETTSGTTTITTNLGGANTAAGTSGTTNISPVPISTVQGVSTDDSLLEKIWNFIFQP